MNLDFGKSFSFVFEDENWVASLLLPGLIMLIPLLGGLYLMGFMFQTAKNVLRGDEKPLPQFEDFGQRLVDGLVYVVISFVYTLPAIALGALVFVPVIFLSNLSYAEGMNDAANLGMILLFVCGMPLVFLAGLFFSLLAQAGYTEYVRSGDFGSALNFGDAWQRLRTNFTGYIGLYLLSVLAGFIGSAGTALFFFGVIFTGPYGQAMFGHYLGQFAKAESKTL